ncbi:hypothetical protein E2C01_078281 [Portunus trituberculatus]|uniref:Uncharacterized protein n=1 Tax=Portunus trituberculatus TaxID=210409 RepID=A0A5B7INF1_PORTR|nr:hypothetical protein [Portunus trituberculatus]
MGRSYGYAPSHIVFRWPNWRARITEDSFSRRVIQEAPEHKHPASGGVARHSSQHMQQGSLYGKSTRLSPVTHPWLVLLLKNCDRRQCSSVIYKNNYIYLHDCGQVHKNSSWF